MAGGGATRALKPFNALAKRRGFAAGALMVSGAETAQSISHQLIRPAAARLAMGAETVQGVGKTTRV